jgi:hypothetical protein
MQVVSPQTKGARSFTNPKSQYGGRWIVSVQSSEFMRIADHPGARGCLTPTVAARARDAEARLGPLGHLAPTTTVGLVGNLFGEASDFVELQV